MFKHNAISNSTIHSYPLAEQTCIWHPNKYKNLVYFKIGKSLFYALKSILFCDFFNVPGGHVSRASTPVCGIRRARKPINSIQNNFIFNTLQTI